MLDDLETNRSGVVLNQYLFFYPDFKFNYFLLVVYHFSSSICFSFCYFYFNYFSWSIF